MVLLLSPSSSRHAAQKNLPPETFSNSFRKTPGRTYLPQYSWDLKTAFPRHCRLPTGGGLVLVWRFRAMSAAVGDFRLSNSDATELEAAVPSLSESKVSLSDTELSGLLLAPLVLAAISACAKGQLCL